MYHATLFYKYTIAQKFDGTIFVAQDLQIFTLSFMNQPGNQVTGYSNFI